MQLEAFESEREERSFGVYTGIDFGGKSIGVVKVGGFCHRIIMRLNIRVVSEQMIWE